MSDSPQISPSGSLDQLRKRFNTVGALWDDATASWIVVADQRRSTFDGCRWRGIANTLDEAVAALLAALPK